MALKAADDGGTGFSIRLDDRAQLFRVELGREGGGAHQVDELDGELAPLGFRLGRHRRLSSEWRGRS